MSYLETSVLYCDDNLHRLAQFPPECIDLIYLDPPFFSNRSYEVIWGDEAEVRSFEDRWEGGINVYANWMRERVIEMHRILKPTGSIYLHCDWHASHYLKVMMDDVFGTNHFRNEIVWHYATGGAGKKTYAHKHDTLLFYSKESIYKFYPDRVKEPRTDKAMQRAQNPQGARISATDDTKLPTDVWQIPALNPMARERLGYPTQKPEELLTKVIMASSDPDDVVLDPFCGCGTTIAVAERLRRQWVGIDISPTAAGLMKRRVEKAGAVDVKGKSTVKLVGMPVKDTQLRALKPFEFQNWVLQRMNAIGSPKKTGDMGIDGLSFMDHLPIQVKQSARVGRNVVDNFETAIERVDKKAGYIVAFSFTKGAYEETARVKDSKNLDIKLLEVAALLEDTTDLITPEQLIPETPLLYSRPKNARPSAEELVKSDRENDSEGITGKP